MTIAAVGGQGGGNFANNATSVSRAFPGSVTAGSLIVILAEKYSPSSDPFVLARCSKLSGTATLSAITLDRNINLDIDPGQNSWASSAAFSARVLTSGSLTMQLSGLVAGSYPIIVTHEFSGNWDDSRLETGVDASSTTDGTASASSGNATSSGAALFIGGLQLNSYAFTTITPDAAFTEIFESEDGTTNATGSAIYRIVTTGTTDSFDWTTGTTHGGWSIAGAVYREAGASSGTPLFIRDSRSGSGGMQDMTGGMSASQILVPKRRFFLPSQRPPDYPARALSHAIPAKRPAFVRGVSF